MGVKYSNLIGSITCRESLWKAYLKASRGKRSTYGYLLFQQNEAYNIEMLSQELKSGIYTPGEHNCFDVYEPKLRKISALPFLDRVVQHSLHATLNPIFDKTFFPNSYACRVGKGTHKGVIKAQSLLRKKPWYLKVDFKGYFYNIDNEVLWGEISKKVNCTETLQLIEKFHPKTGKGIPIGNLTSQLMANIYGNILDRELTHRFKVDWIRYMDDTVIFGNCPSELVQIKEELTEFVEETMKLKWSKWFIKPSDKGLNYLGYRIYKRYKLIRKDSVLRAKRKVRKLKGGEKDKFLASWKGHVKWANSHNLLTKLERS